MIHKQILVPNQMFRLFRQIKLIKSYLNKYTIKYYTFKYTILYKSILYTTFSF